MRVISVDLDGYLWDDGIINYEIINKVNELFDKPDTLIVINTARSEFIRKQTVELLSQIGVKYHCLKMEKFRADYYLDDKNANIDDLLQ